MSKKRFQLRADETAQENLWRAANIAARYIVGKTKLYNVDDERDEIIESVTLRTVQDFMRIKIGEHEYNRAHPFFDNVYSSCWSCAHHIIDMYIRQKKRDISNKSLDESIGVESLTYADVLSDDYERHLANYISKYNRAVLDGCDKAVIGMHRSSNFKAYAEAALKQLWTVDDEEAAYECKVRDEAAVREHREAVLQRVRDFVNSKSKQ